MPEATQSAPEYLDLGASEFEMSFKDFRGTVHVFFHRMPTPEECAKLKALEFQIKKKGKTRQVLSPDDMRPVFHSLGLKLATGFRKGTLGFEGKLIASDQDDPDFKANWRKLVAGKMPDVFTAIGVRGYRPVSDANQEGTEFEEVSASLNELVAALGFDSLDDLMNQDNPAPAPSATIVEETADPLSNSSNG